MNRLAILAVVACTGCDETVRSGLDEGAANEIEAVLSEHGIAVRKSREGGKEPTYAVRVPREAVGTAVRILRDNDLPRAQPAGFGDVFGKGSMVPTATEERALFVHALSGEIARTLATLDGVASARVHVVPAAPPRLGQAPARARASVLVKARPGRGTEVKGRGREIQALVAGSVDGLEPDQVSVMLSEIVAPPPVAAPGPAQPYRELLVAAGGVIAVLALALVVAALRVRGARRPVPAAAPARPVGTPRPAARAA